MDPHKPPSKPPSMETDKKELDLNPFMYTWPNKTFLTKSYALLKYGIGIFVVPVKVVALVAMLGSATTWGVISKIVGPSPDKPPSFLQKLCFWPVRISCRILLTVLGFYWIKTKGKPATASEAPIIVSNHIHLWEVAYLFSVFGPSAVSRKENASIPGVGQLLQASRAILVDRYSSTSRADTLKAIKNRGELASKDSRWPQLLIFPEGTTSNGKSVCSFKVGAFAAGLPVQPIAVKYPYKYFDPCWSIDGPGMNRSILGMCCQFVNYMEITYLPVYHPSAEEIANPSLYAKNVRNLIAKELGVPATDHSYEDALLQVQALKHKIPLDKFNTSMQSISGLLQLNFEQARELLGRFGKAHRTGLVDFPAFCKFLNLPPTEEVRDLFDAFDTIQAGYIDLRALILGMATLNDKSQHTARETIERAWKLFDFRGNGTLSKESITTVLRTIFNDIKDEEITTMFEQADLNKDGRLSWEEFDTYWRRHPEYLALAETMLRKWGTNTSSSTPQNEPSSSS